MITFLNTMSDTLSLFILQTQANMHYLLVMIITIFGFLVASRFFPILLAMGIWPRKVYGLPGIFFAPFLHLNFNHLFFNMVPLVILSNFLLINGLQYFLIVSLYITFISGVCIWCFAKPGVHVGSSAVITGYWGLLIMNIYLQGSLMAVILGLVCIYYFAGVFLGVFPGKKGVSWEGHLFGLLAGIATSYLVVA